MSTTNPSPNFGGHGQRMPRAMQEELTRIKEEGTLNTPKPLMPSPKITPNLERTNCPQWIQPSEDNPQGDVKGPTPLRGTRGSEGHQGSTQQGGYHFSQYTGGALRRALTAGKSAVGPREVHPKEPPRFFPGQNTTSQESEVEETVRPRQGLSMTSTIFMWRQACFQCQSCPETTSLLTGHSGTLWNLPVPENCRSLPSQTSLPETCPRYWAKYKVRYVSGDCYGSLTRIYQSLPHWINWGH